MKKAFLVLAVIFTAAFAAQAESSSTKELIEKGKAAYAASSPRAIGLRLGYGLSATYQQQLGEANMVSLDVDIPGFTGIGATATYDWLNPFNAQFKQPAKGEFNWYLGVGASAGTLLFPRHTLDNFTDINTNIYAGVAARCGVEFNFWFPLQLAVEYRPTIGILYHSYKQIDNTTNTVLNHHNEVNFFAEGLYVTAFTFCVRYRF